MSNEWISTSSALPMLDRLDYANKPASAWMLVAFDYSRKDEEEGDNPFAIARLEGYEEPGDKDPKWVSGCSEGWHLSKVSHWQPLPDVPVE
jgi:hypothetical protein